MNNSEEVKPEMIMIEMPIEHFALQYQFAERAKELTGKDLHTCLMEYTAYYKRIGIPDWDFNPNNTQWKSFLSTAKSKDTTISSAYKLYLDSLVSTHQIEKETTRFGCFRYETAPEVISLHFANKDTHQAGPLSRERYSVRLEELKSMFAHIQASYPDTRYVKGASWLYNYSSYCRLFPPKFSENMSIEEVPFPRTNGVWGQFITSERKLNQQSAATFISKFMQAQNEDEPLQCFPFKILSAQLPIEEFYKFYGL